MIYIVCGGRDFVDGWLVVDTMDRLRLELGITEIIEGGQRTYDRERNIIGGADWFAMRWATARGIPVHTEEARWHALDVPGARIKKDSRGRDYNVNAGFDRNALMITKYKPAGTIAFKGNNGTKNMIEQSRRAGLSVIEVGA